MSIQHKNIIIYNLLLVSLFLSCKKFVEIDPPKSQITTTSVFKNDATATASIRGIYSEMIGSTDFASGGTTSISFYTGLSGDEFINYRPQDLPFRSNSLLSTESLLKTQIWDRGFKFIYYANSILENLDKSSGVTSKTKKLLAGEAKFIRAFCHFYLVNLFGEIPVVTTTDYRINNSISRSPKAQVYEQIVLDLKDAQTVLSDAYEPEVFYLPAERVRPNQSAATALLARVYLYINDWPNAELQSSAVINNTSLYSLEPSLNSVFLANSSETIWQLKPVLPGKNTNEAQTFLPRNTATPPTYVSLTNDLVNAFEPGDQRITSWVRSYTHSSVTYYYSYKYKVLVADPLEEYSMVLRLSEQYFIRAEARAQQNNIGGSQSDVNAIRNRAGLLNTTAIDKASLLSAIEQERRIELFSEWGHRWFDLKRTNRADAVVGPVKAPNWQPTDVLYPIPQVDRNINPNLTQNTGY